jgi:5-methylcytosine-specific restriction endonuclease McrA
MTRRVGRGCGRRRKVKLLRGEQRAANLTRMLADDPHCYYCGRPLNDATATLDHVFPRCRGGTNIKTNLVLACAPCNGAKGDKMNWPVADAVGAG